MKKGFTLIELLAVIVILAIIALIAVPIILDIIEDTKTSSFKETINGILRAAESRSAFDIGDQEEILYKYENGSWENLKLELDGEIPKYIEIKINKEGKIRYAITNGIYGFIKNEYDGKEELKKIGNKNNDKQIQEEYCALDALIPTDESCFEVNSSGKITNYKCFENNEEGQPEIKKLVIPSKINGTTVKSIDAFAFKNKGLTSVVIPNTITSIGTEAFSYNNLSNIDIPSSVKNIYTQAFRDNCLTSLEIQNGVTRIGEGAFSWNCLEEIVIPDSVVKIGEDAFINNQLKDENAFIYNRNSDGSINYSSLNSYGGKNREDVIIPDGVETIGVNAFAWCDIKKITIPNSVKNIERTAFRNNKLTSIVIPDGVISIGDYAFYDNELTKLTIPRSVTQIGSSAFSGFSNNLSSVIIEGKLSSKEFEKYGSSIFNWKSNCSDSTCITWKGSN